MIGELSYNEAMYNYLWKKYKNQNYFCYIYDKGEEYGIPYIYWLEDYIKSNPVEILDLFNYFKNNLIKKDILTDFINLCKISTEVIDRIINNIDTSLEIKLELINNYIYFNGYIPNNINNNIIEKAIAGRKIVKYIKNAMNDQFILTKLKYNIELKRIKKILD